MWSKTIHSDPPGGWKGEGGQKVIPPGESHCGYWRNGLISCFMDESPRQAAKAPEHAGSQSRDNLAVSERLGDVVLRHGWCGGTLPNS